MPIGPSTADAPSKYLLTSKISLNVIDGLVRDNLVRSYLWLALTVAIVVALLAANTRIFQYAVLFRKLKEVDKMKDDFISMASHELRAPITAIRGYLSLFLEDAFGAFDEKPKSIMRTLFQVSTHLHDLVEDLLDVSRIEQGRLQLSPEPVKPEDAIDEVMGEMKFEAEKKGLAFSFRRPSIALPTVMADKARLRQVLVNLVSNAVKYTQKGSVTVTAEAKEGPMVEIRVADTGVGMSAEARERLFQKFYRIKTDDTRGIPGTGLGLWITKQIVEAMKGKIFVESIEKVGTQMGLLLPAATATPISTPSSPAGTAPAPHPTVPAVPAS